MRSVIVLFFGLCLLEPARAEPAALAQLRAQAFAYGRGSAPPSPRIPAAVQVPASRAHDAVSSITHRMMSGMPFERRARLRRVHVFLAGRGEHLVDAAIAAVRSELGDDAARRVERGFRDDYAMWSRLAASSSEPRVSSPIRGVSQLIDGHVFCIVGEENMTAAEWDENGSRAGRIAVHEFAHAVEDVGMTAEEQAELDRIWLENLRRRGLPEKESGFKTEFFAESTEAWFRVHQHSPYEKGHGPDFFYNRFPGMAGFLERIYGPAL